MFWVLFWMALTGCIVITSQISFARGGKRLSRALLETMVADLIFGALLAWRSL